MVIDNNGGDFDQAVLLAVFDLCAITHHRRRLLLSVWNVLLKGGR